LPRHRGPPRRFGLTGSERGVALRDRGAGVNSYPRRGLHGRVVQVVGQRIAQGINPPGDPLDVASLGAEFGVSRTVVREALKVLAAKGLVDARPKRGTFVRPRADWSLLDPDVLRWRFGNRADRRFLGELAEVRLIVEPAAARLAAARRSTEDLAALDRAVAGLGRPGATPQDVIAADIAFHCGLLRASHKIGRASWRGRGYVARDAE